MRAYSWLRGRLSNLHLRGPKPDIFIFATPRSGSTFLMELLGAQSDVKIYNEPFSMRKEVARRELGVESWAALTRLDGREAAFGRYVDRLRRNRLPELNRPLYWKSGRFLTRRNVFKILHSGEDMLAWFAERFGGLVVVLLRHPIPTVQSHRHFPRLPHFLEQPGMRALFTGEQIRLTEALIRSGTTFEKGIVDWCLQVRPMLIALDEHDFTVITYEDLTAYPEPSVRHLEARLDLAPTRDIAALVARPSESTVQSDPDTVKFLSSEAAMSDRVYLVEKWLARTSAEDEARCFEILGTFGIDAYEAGSVFANARYRIPGVDAALAPARLDGGRRNAAPAGL